MPDPELPWANSKASKTPLTTQRSIHAADANGIDLSASSGPVGLQLASLRLRRADAARRALGLRPADVTASPAVTALAQGRLPPDVALGRDADEQAVAALAKACASRDGLLAAAAEREGLSMDLIDDARAGGGFQGLSQRELLQLCRSMDGEPPEDRTWGDVAVDAFNRFDAGE
jgi:hypothetical protein